jgi:hypothetical protein
MLRRDGKVGTYLFIITEYDTRVLTILQWRGHGMSSGVSCFTVDVI